MKDLKIKNITFKEEEISKKEAKSILDAYFDTKDKRYKKWLEEITPFKGCFYKNYFNKLKNHFWIKKILKENKSLI